ncbi:MAG: UvrD-helicase domain-containing protein [Elusimicrobiaceae bacterium]|nr:UvrD-helicase domain-containing protein [Elusimicrobiaceae bacterium]
MSLQDLNARTTAIENNSQNIIVEAGAGTGKTTLLVRKMLFLVFVKKVKLSRVVALTFTTKAAASLKQKMEETLHKAYEILLHNSFVLTATDEVYNERLQSVKKEDQKKFDYFRSLFQKSDLNLDGLFALVKTALEELPLCQIGTIHSFCNFLLKKYAVEAGLSTNMKIDEAGVIDIIFDKYWALFLEEELTLNSTKKDVWLKLLKEVDLQDLYYFAHNLCNPGFEDYNPINNYTLLRKQAQKYLQEVELLVKEHPTNKKGNMVPLLKTCVESLKQTIAFYGGERSDFAEPEFPSFPGKLIEHWEQKDFDLAREIVTFTQDNTPHKQKLLAMAFQLLQPFAAKVQREMLKQNYLTFDEIIFKTHHLLLSNRAVRQEVKLSYDNIFIDEFQDTDPIQGEIMLFLAEKLDTFANKWQDLILEHGKLFIVGDPKQSIYRFRGADISAYQEFCNLLTKQGALSCVLQNNFRSAGCIIDYVNNFGKNQIKFKKNCQAEYQEIYPSKEFNKASVELHLHKNSEDTNKANARIAHANCIAKWICDNVKKTVKSDGNTLDYKDIALLLPTATDVNIFLDALKENNIPYNVEADKNFYSAQEILDLINILKVLKNPQDKIALLGVLRSPICLMKDGDLVTLSQENKLNIYADVNNEKLQNTYKKLRVLIDKLSALNPLEIVNEILDIFNFTACQTLTSSNEQILANIAKFKQVVAKLFENGSYTLEQLLDNFETYQKETNEESSAILAEENFNVIKILTIHKAKGLEFPVVILTDLSKQFSQGNNRQKGKSKTFYSRSLNLKGLTLGDIKDGIVPLIEQERQAQELEEKRRLLYVAMTRAKEALIIVDSLQAEEKTFTKFLSDSACWPNEEMPENILTAKAFYHSYNLPELPTEKQISEENKNFSFNYPAWIENFNKIKAEFETYLKDSNSMQRTNTTLFPSKEVEHAIKVGSLCHKMLQNVFNKTMSNFDNEEDKSALTEAQEIINNFCRSSAYKELENMEFLASEFPITTLQNGIVKNGVIDALFKTKEGNIRIIDFKSDKINIVTDKTVEPEYLKQIAFYKNALKGLFKGKIESALVYLRSAEIYKVEE